MMEKLKHQLADADAADEARKKASEASIGPKPIGEGLVIDEWVRLNAILFTSLLELFFFVLRQQSMIMMFNVLLFCNYQKQRRERYLAQQQGGVDSAWNQKITKTKCVCVFL